jgi:hypothetical protein
LEREEHQEEALVLDQPLLTDITKRNIQPGSITPSKQIIPFQPGKIRSDAISTTFQLQQQTDSLRTFLVFYS